MALWRGPRGGCILQGGHLDLIDLPPATQIAPLTKQIHTSRVDALMRGGTRSHLKVLLDALRPAVVDDPPHVLSKRCSM